MMRQVKADAAFDQPLHLARSIRTALPLFVMHDRASSYENFVRDLFHPVILPGMLDSFPHNLFLGFATGDEIAINTSFAAA